MEVANKPIYRAVADLSSLCWTYLYNGTDKENGYEVQFNGKPVKINSAEHGYEGAVDFIVSALNRFKIVPSDMIMVIEGENSKSLRRNIMDTYKGSDERAPELYEEFNKLKAKLVDTFTKLGAQAVTQSQVESDDVIAYLCQNLEGKVLILSNDGDLSILVDNERVFQYRNGVLIEDNIYGPFDRKYITVYKALVGDTSDKIPGAKGFGEKAWLDLLVNFDEEGLALMEGLIVSKQLARLSEDVGTLKALQKIIDNADMVYKSYDCAKLYPEKVNTLRKPLIWTAGMVRPASEIKDERLNHWGGKIRLVDAANYETASKFFASKIAETPYFTLDIETTTPEESDDWLMRAKGKSDDDKDLGVDVFGSTLCGMAVTFGANRQYTFYFPVDHTEADGFKNVTKIEALQIVDMIPLDRPNIIQNVSFELTVLYQEWSEYWDNGDWAGFIPNAWDTAIMASYVDENQSRGLKHRSATLLNYRQETYKEVTTYEGLKSEWDGRGRVVSEWHQPVETGELDDEGKPKMDFETGPLMVIVVRKMSDLSASHVLSYGADDTICTSALYNHYRIIMEIEHTWDAFMQVEIYPAYLTALAYVQGTPISLERLKELEREDAKAHEESMQVLNKFLIAKGWDGTVCPVYTEFTPANIKEAYAIVTGEELKNATRTVSKYPAILDNLDETMLAEIVRTQNLDALNKYVKSKFSGIPNINFGSPKQVKKFLYETLALPVRIVNKLTPNEREKQPELAKAVSKFNKIWQGSLNTEMTPEEMLLLREKASTDDTAVDFALAMDVTDEQREILKAMVTCKKVQTRQNLYYTPYPNLMHWRDSKLHSSLNQSATTTRRYTSGGPNLQQLPKKGDGTKVREIIVPHCKDGVIISLDYSGQELRLGAETSQCPNMLACYIGDNLKDLHSLTASGAMVQKWGEAKVEELRLQYPQLVGLDEYSFFSVLRKIPDTAKLADDLRKVAKVINFGSAYGAQAAKLAQTLVISVQDAQTFLDARAKVFGRVIEWNQEIADFAEETGYSLTLLGGRRHLRSGVRSDDKWEREAAARQAANFVIQGSAAEMTKLGIARLWKSGVMFKCNARFIAPIHDELVVSCHRDDVLEVIKVMNDCMTAPYANMQVPIIASISIGPNFGKQLECGDDYNESSINDAIDKIFKKDSNLKAA